ncbi:MAG: FkbM family methyltransferase [Bacteroidetes bacterium]|nr:FkbM family methyltransferase [Bacteroidota bacterium]MCL2303033.1 FkbM family methyltransferase [Lentimicrobiaceae bacterium]
MIWNRLFFYFCRAFNELICKLVKLYRKYIPSKIRHAVNTAFLGATLIFFRNFRENLKAKRIYLFQRILPDTEKNRMYAFMGKHGLTQCPYPFVLEYKNRQISYFFDEQSNMFYINHAGKKLYFPKTYKEKEIVSMYKTLIMEQDIRSPHQYVKNINRLKGKILLDIGAAEALFSLDAIELVNYVYIFECDENWIEALTATFEPWKNKIMIVRKYVTDINDENNITIDRFLEGKEKTNLFLKMDIEGYEQVALKGASDILKEAHDIDFSICTYHKENDVVEIANILQTYGLEYEQTDGYLHRGKDFRKAIIRRK